MTSWVVIDSGVYLATVLPERYSVKATVLIRSLTQQNNQVVVPTLFRYEIVSVIRKSVVRGVLTSEQALERLNTLFAQSVQDLIDDKLLQRAYDLATQYNRPTAYDSQYLAVAERFSCDFWTADEKLFNSVKQYLSWVKWLGNVPN